MKSLVKALAVTLFFSLASPAIFACGSKAKASDSARVATPSDSIVAVATEAGSFSTLLAALKATGLDEVLAQEGPFTVFAPTDEAFAKLPAGTLEALLKDPAQLKAILLYHVVPGSVTSSEVGTLTSATTAHGLELAVKADASGVRVGGASVVRADVKAGNGVIHVIDTVLVPSA